MFLALLGFSCCVLAFSSCDKRGILSSCNAWASHWGSFPCYRTWVLRVLASAAVVLKLSCSEALGVFPVWSSNLCPCIGRWTLSLWTIREVQQLTMSIDNWHSSSRGWKLEIKVPAWSGSHGNPAIVADGCLFLCLLTKGRGRDLALFPLIRPQYFWISSPIQPLWPHLTLITS